MLNGLQWDVKERLQVLAAETSLVTVIPNYLPRQCTSHSVSCNQSLNPGCDSSPFTVMKDWRLRNP